MYECNKLRDDHDEAKRPADERARACRDSHHEINRRVQNKIKNSSAASGISCESPSGAFAAWVAPSRATPYDEVYLRQCPCRRAFDLGSVLEYWRIRRRSDESKGTRGFTQVQPPRKVKGLRPACLTLY
jgi:hypothetical protein